MAEPLLPRGGGARKRRLSPVGASWDRGLYTPDMGMPEPTITSLAFFDEAPSLKSLVDEFEKHVWPLYRFNSTVVHGEFVPVEGPMDRAYHFKQLDFPDEARLHSFVQGCMAEPLDRSRPLWQAQLLKVRQGRSALMLRLHHLISDGLGLLFAFLPLLKCKDGDVLSKIPLPAIVLPKELRPKPKPSEAASRSSGAPPRKRRPGVCENIRMFFRGVLSILVMKEDSPIAMNGPPGERKPFLRFSGRHVFTRMPSVPTNVIKAVRTTHGCTFNDAIMAALSGAFRRYSIEHLKDPLVMGGGPVECKAFMLLGLPRPVDLKDASVSLANKFLTPVFRLPIDEPTPIGRLLAATRTCGDLKSLAYILGIQATTNLLAKIAPVSFMRKVTSEAISKCTCNITNLPFPDVPVTMAEREVKEVQVLFVNNIPQISMISYNGYLHWNMISDPAQVPNPELLGRFFLEEFPLLTSGSKMP